VRANDAAGNLSNYSTIASATTLASGASIAVSVSPGRGGLTTSQTLLITATLSNDAGNQGVTWSSSGGGSFLPPASTSGNPVSFTAPATAGVVTITATSVADGTKSATAVIGVTDLTGVFTYHNNISRDVTNQQEFALTPSNVTASTFGKMFSCTVDAAIYAQPLWIPKVSIGVGTHNVILVATMRNSVYVFDADASPCKTYWSKQLIPRKPGAAMDLKLGHLSGHRHPGTPSSSVDEGAHLVTKTKTISRRLSTTASCRTWPMGPSAPTVQ
jgi:hypothetical protein